MITLAKSEPVTLTDFRVFDDKGEPMIKNGGVPFMVASMMSLYMETFVKARGSDLTAVEIDKMCSEAPKWVERTNLDAPNFQFPSLFPCSLADLSSLETWPEWTNK